jgi:hypothetical protein
VESCGATDRTRLARIDGLLERLIIDLQLIWISNPSAAQGEQLLMSLDQAASTAHQQWLELIGQGP